MAGAVGRRASVIQMRVGVIGTGLVGRRAARELVGLPEVGSVVLLTGTTKERARLAESLGSKAAAGPFETVDADSLTASEVDTVVLCGLDEDQPDLARLALGVGCHVVSVADSVETVDTLFGMDDFAREVDRSVVVGANMSPGWSTVLAWHASTLLDEIDEVSIAVTGSAGAACHERRAKASRTDTQEWRDDGWVECAARSAPELVWFPDPLGAVDCARGDLSEAVLLRRLLPEVPQIAVKMGRPTAHPIPQRVRRLGRRPAPQEAGGVRVAVSGRTVGQSSTVVYGLLSPPAASTAVLAALATRAVHTAPAGVRGVAEVLDPVETLRAAAERGVRGLVYEGID